MKPVQRIIVQLRHQRAVIATGIRWAAAKAQRSAAHFYKAVLNIIEIYVRLIRSEVAIGIIAIGSVTHTGILIEAIGGVVASEIDDSPFRYSRNSSLY